MSAAKLFRTVTNAKIRRRREMATLRVRMAELRARVEADSLTDVDYRLLARMGPNARKHVGYVPRVSL